MRKSRILNELLDQENHKIKTEFKATNMPNFSKISKMKPSQKALTKAKAPMLQSESRIQLRKERELMKQIEAEAKELSVQDATEFDVTIKSSPMVRLEEQSGYDINDQDSVMLCGEFNQ
jgi:hypothetical protein